jgi:hypothetical protein
MLVKLYGAGPTSTDDARRPALQPRRVRRHSN